MDVEGIKERQARVWGMGDYAAVSGMLAPAARQLCDSCAVSAGQEVLDVAAGDGNFALACAREGARVVASDIAPGMVERGRARSAAEGYEIEWLEADAEALPFDDDRFDCVGSVFGAMIAPRPRVVAGELLRVVRPGGIVGMTAWIPGSAVTEMFSVGRKYAPPSDQPLSEEWSEEDAARERFEGLAASLELERHTLAWEGESPEALVAQMMDFAPPWAAARQALSPEQLDAARLDLLEVTRSGADGDGPVRLEAPYRLILARKRG